MKWYTKAANQEYAQAQYLLGKAYDKGEGVAKNDSEAMKWYLKAVKTITHKQPIIMVQCS